MAKITRRMNIGVSESIVAYMVKIEWTNAQVVKIRANQSFKMTCCRVAVLHGEYQILAPIQITLKPGQTFYFAASHGLPGYYYLVQSVGTRFSCTCPAGKTHQECYHQVAVREVVYTRMMEAA